MVLYCFLGFELDNKAREKGSSFDRILRQRAVNYLKTAEEHSLRLMESTYDKKKLELVKRIDKLRNNIVKIRGDIEFGSFISMPTLRSGRRFRTEAPTRADEEIPRMLLIGEMILLECRNLFEKLQATEKQVEVSETEALESLSKAEDSLSKIEQLQLSRSSSTSTTLDSIISSYQENVNALETLAKKEDLAALERSQLTETFLSETGSPFERLFSLVSRKSTFEKEITDTILLIGENLRTKTGGLVRLPDLYTMVKAVKPSLKINLEDVENVVIKLEKKGAIPGLREASGIKIVEFVPVTATPDQDVILVMASDKGHLKIEEVLLDTKWTHERAERALKQLEELGIAKYDMAAHRWDFQAFFSNNK